MAAPPTRDDRQSRLNSHFHQVLNGKKTINNQRVGDLFLESICAQTDASSCVTKLLSSGGLTPLKISLHMRQIPSFLNGLATSLLRYLQNPVLKTICAGDLLQQVVLAVVDPPIFWDAFVRVFREGGLQEQALQAFAWLLLELITLPAEKAAAGKYLQLASEDRVQKVFLDSPVVEIRTLGHRIKHVVSTVCTTQRPFDGEAGGPGGRHDNDAVNFREISILPTADELASVEKPFLRLAGALEEAEEEERLGVHLDSQFRLLREELLVDMREELQIALGMKKKKHRGIVVEGMTVVGFEFQKTWGVKLQCVSDFGQLKKIHDPPARKKFFTNNPNVFKHNTRACLLVDGQAVAFPTITRDIDLLAAKPPIVTLLFNGPQSTFAQTIMKLKTGNNIKLVQIDTAVFSIEPILHRLQQIKEMELQNEILSWKKGTKIGRTSSWPWKIVDSIESDPTQDLMGLLGGKKSIKLDKSQCKSLIMGLKRRVSLIQGPPGTGKSFIGALIAKIIHEFTSKTILVVCYTNHAIDQFLEDLMDVGIPDKDMVRFGNFAKCSQRTQPLLFNNRVKYTKDSRFYINELTAECGRVEITLSKELLDYMTSKISNQELMEYLEFLDDGPPWYDAFTVPVGEDGWEIAAGTNRRIDEYYLLDRWRMGKDAGVFNSQVAPEHYAIWTMLNVARNQVNLQWLMDLLKDKAKNLGELAAEYNECQRKLAKMRKQSDIEALKGKRVIGCTTTAAATRFDEIQAANVDVLLVEEAGEILESHILTAMGPKTDQLIMIGDHKQLRPKVNNYNLTVAKGEGYDLDRSLFERLVLKGFPHQTLTAQHRMRPEISALVRHITYPDLIDAPKTQGRPNIRGLDHNVVFFSHSKPEDVNPKLGNQNPDGMTYKSSKQNTFEAQLVLKCVRYLAQQGYGTENMVVLTPYLGQLYLLRDLLSTDNDPVLNDLDSYDLVRAGLLPAASAKLTKKPIKLSTIDNYQGEEADIVIATLTRSNPDYDIGFLTAPERLNVLVSRARDGLIIIGNPETFLHSRRGHDLWSRFFDHLKEHGQIHDGLPVHCERHPDRKMLLGKPTDFDEECPDGGCKEPCGTMLSCGLHPCPQRCHQLANHSKMPCDFVLHNKCANGHSQSWKCSQGIPLSCNKCDRYAREAEKQRQKDFKRQQKRDEEVKEHLREMAALDDEIEQQRQRLKDEQDRKDRERTLAQKKKDLRDAEAAVNSAAADTHTSSLLVSVRPTPAVTATAPAPATPAPATPTPITSPTSTRPKTPSAPQQPTTPSRPQKPAPSTPPPVSAAEFEWQRQKTVENAQNAALDALMDMTGLENVKAQVLSLKGKIDTSIRQNVDFKNERFGVVMLGNPGTGKTTVARLYAKFLNTYQGVLPGNEFFETTGSRLANDGVAGAKKAIEDILKAGGGAFFLDEAYQLTEKQSFGGAQVLDFLLAEIENNIGKIVFIFAGYNKNMEKFFEHNPGIPSRIPYSLQFDNYKDPELHLMLTKMIDKWYKGKMEIEDGMWGLYMRIAVRRLGRGRGRNGFGNARDLANMFAKIRERQGERLSRERRNGMMPDDFFLKREDLIGPDPTQAMKESKAWDKLQQMIGLHTVKQSVQSMIGLIETNYERELIEKDPMECSLNRVFLGSPGTGKTTVAKFYGLILTDLGLLSNGEVVIKNPSDFVGSVLGESESNTKAILATTVGKVLIIDEAYMLYAGGDGVGKVNDPYKTAVIDTLVAEVQSTPGEDRCVLLLGYEDQMVSMFQNVNPGLQRRFALEDAFHFQDFTNAQLRTILELKLKQQDLGATEEAKDVVCEMLGRARMKPNFGNGGEVENRLSVAKTRFQQRQSKKPPAERSIDVVFEPVDFDPNFARGESAALNCRKLFEDVVGCEDIIAKLEGYQQTAVNAKAAGIPLHELIPTNFLFKGPPGTGKTTTARKMGRVYYDMGFLSSDKVVECSASDLVAEYVGQTGPKTQKQLEKGLGQVLFIDEAYRLTEGHFGAEAVNELVDILTKPKFLGKIVVILAGYDNDINRLLKMNPGLPSRFPEEVVFTNMAPEDCVQVMKRDLAAKKVKADWLDSETAAYGELLDIVEKLSVLDSWGNARDMKTLAKKMIGLVFKKPRDGSAPSLLAQEGLDCARQLLAEREARANVAPSPMPFGIPQAQMLPPRGAPAPPATPTKRATRQKPPAKKEEPKPPPPAASDRDPGVSDAVWTQLQADRAAEVQRAHRAQAEIKKKEQEAKKQQVLEKVWEKELAELAAKKAKDDAELQELKRRQEAARLAQLNARIAREKALRELEAAREAERKRQQEEAKAQQKLRSMGVCPVGFQWVKGAGGYRCTGGSHFVSNAALGL